MGYGGKTLSGVRNFSSPRMQRSRKGTLKRMAGQTTGRCARLKAGSSLDLAPSSAVSMSGVCVRISAIASSTPAWTSFTSRSPNWSASMSAIFASKASSISGVHLANRHVCCFCFGAWGAIPKASASVRMQTALWS